MSFQESGRILIEPVLVMKSTYFMTFCGVVVNTIAGSLSMSSISFVDALSIDIRRYASAAQRLSLLISAVASSSALTKASYSFGFSLLNFDVVQTTLNVAGPP